METAGKGGRGRMGEEERGRGEGRRGEGKRAMWKGDEKRAKEQGKRFALVLGAPHI